MSPALCAHVTGQAPAIAANARAVNGGMFGFDFHLGGKLPQLIEINTNPGGLMVNLELARAVTACCPEVAEPMAALTAVSLSPDEVAAQIIGCFRSGWSAARGDVPLTTLALVDDDPPNQYLYPEFLLFQRLFERRLALPDRRCRCARGPRRRPVVRRGEDRSRLQPPDGLLPG